MTEILVLSLLLLGFSRALEIIAQLLSVGTHGYATLDRVWEGRGWRKALNYSQECQEGRTGGSDSGWKRGRDVGGQRYVAFYSRIQSKRQHVQTRGRPLTPL